MNTRMICIGTLAMMACLNAWAGGTPQGSAFTYQGVLRVNGSPANGTHHLRFQLWDALTAGAPVGAEMDVPGLVMENGLFTTALNFGPAAFDGSARWLEIRVITNGGATVTTLAPRQPVNAAPYALFALAVDGPSLNNLNASNLASGTVPGPQLAGGYANALTFSNAANAFTGAFAGSGAGLIDLNGSNIGSGNLAPARLPTGGAWTLASNLNLDGNTFVVDDSNNRVGIGTATPTTAIDVAGTARMTGFQLPTGAAAGKVLRSDGAGSGTWQDDGLTFPISSGLLNILAVPALYIFNSGSNNSIRADSVNYTAIQGYTSSTYTGHSGVSGQGYVRGVIGHATFSGSTIGVYGQADSADGVGVYGFASATSGATKGVLGEALSASGYAIYAAGRLIATGTKSFRIDHPDDPENKYLLHYCAESPEVINFYSGKTILDGAGEAVVTLPAYFAKINRDPRYLLTAIGAAMPNLHVALEIDEAALEAGARAQPGETAPACWFRIAGGVPGAKVSWEVKAVRNDRWMQRRESPVEQAKPENERGSYLHPDLYDRPPEMGTFHRFRQGG